MRRILSPGAIMPGGMSPSEPPIPENSPSSPAPRDRVYATPRSPVAPFEFNEEVAAVFDDMASRSIPGYGDTIAMAASVAARFGQPMTRGYDLGCSLGSTLLSMASAAPASMTWTGVDTSQAMLSRCHDRLTRRLRGPKWALRCEEIQRTSVEDASLVALNFTLQFVPVDQRLELLERIAQGLVPGGVLMMSEKLLLDEQRAQGVISELHLDFKRRNGYSELEISQKRSALEDTLIPETESTHHERLQRAGFQWSVTWMRSLNFASILAFRDG